jgi:SAM-dependent methyltransferase
MKDIFGQALLDYYHNQFKGPLLLHNEYGKPEIIPVESYFRSFDEYTDLEVFALEHLKGKALDVGAATGRHALFLQKEGFDVTAMDISPACGQLMKAQGIEHILIMDVLDYQNDPFDTVFMLMNGIGVAGNMDGLRRLLVHLKKLVKPNGQVLLDSSDISYLYENQERHLHKYFGQLKFHYEYNGVEDEAFEWLYIDQTKLMEVALECGWNCMIIYEDDADAYLARLIHD